MLSLSIVLPSQSGAWFSIHNVCTGELYNTRPCTNVTVCGDDTVAVPLLLWAVVVHTVYEVSMLLLLHINVVVVDCQSLNRRDSLSA